MCLLNLLNLNALSLRRKNGKDTIPVFNQVDDSFMKLTENVSYSISMWIILSKEFEVFWKFKCEESFCTLRIYMSSI